MSLVAVLALVAGACGDDDTDTSETSETSAPGDDTASGADCDPGDDVSIGYSTPVPQAAFDLLIDTMQFDADEAGYEFTNSVANGDPNKQISDVDSMVQQGVNVLIVAPLVEEAILPAVQRAQDAGVAVIGHDIKGDTSPYDAVVGTDAATAAHDAALYIEELVGADPVATILGPTFAPALIERNDAFAEGADEAGLDVVAEETNLQIGTEGARVIADTFAQEYGADLAAVWAFNDVSALGVASAIQGDFEPAVVGMNADPEAIEAIEAETMVATWDLQPVVSAHTLVWAGEQVLCENEVPDRIITPTYRVDADNVGDFVAQEDRIEEAFEVELEERDGVTYVVTELG